jgi:hypothetical protein
MAEKYDTALDTDAESGRVVHIRDNSARLTLDRMCSFPTILAQVGSTLYWDSRLLANLDDTEVEAGRLGTPQIVNGSEVLRGLSIIYTIDDFDFSSRGRVLGGHSTVLPFLKTIFVCD